MLKLAVTDSGGTTCRLLRQVEVQRVSYLRQVEVRRAGYLRQVEKPSSIPPAESSEKARKSENECHDNPLSTMRAGKKSAGRVKRGDSNELCRIPQKEKGTESEVSAIDKLADIAKDKIQTLIRENTELKRKALAFIPMSILTSLKNGLYELFILWTRLRYALDKAMILQETIGAKEKELEEMTSQVNFIASIVQSSDPIYVPINEYEVNTCRGILENVSASTSIHKTRVEQIKKTLDDCRGKLEKQFKDVCIETLRKSDGMYISMNEFVEVVDSFVADFEPELPRDVIVPNFTIFVATHLGRNTILGEFIKETIQPLLRELNNIEVTVERRLIINAFQIKEDYVSCKTAAGK
ncbi:hypothetical protein SUGI_0245060 [Cryptomeria japonica]|nr:hypothetical protein SUGI_0245060 [Cryptomeria japonica]